MIIPATASPEKFDAALSAADNAVIMKVYKNFAYVQEELRKHHMMKRSVMVSRAGLPDEIIQRDLDSLPADYKPNYLSTIPKNAGIPGIVSMEYLSESLNSLKIYMYVL